MEVMPHIAILDLEGLLPPMLGATTHSCLLISPVPFTEELMDVLQMDILSALKLGTPSEVEERKKEPFKVIRELLSKDGINVVDVANISIARAGNSIWTQTAGHRFHANKLERLVFME